MKRAYVVTGGAAGIGKATVLRLSRDGHVVVALDLNEDALQAVVNAPVSSIVACPGDVRDESVLERAADLAEERGVLHGWVNNAAALEGGGALHEADFAEIERILSINIDAPIRASAIAVRRFLAAGTRGSIVNVSSIHASRGFAGYTAYDVAKAALDGLTRVTAVEYGPQGIRANAVAPALILTERMRPDPISLGDPRESESEDDPRHALNRPGLPAEVAEAIAFLLSDAASFITGHVLAVDGGWSILGQVHSRTD